MARDRGCDVVAVCGTLVWFCHAPVSTARALSLLDGVGEGRPEAPVMVEWYAVPALHVVPA